MKKINDLTPTEFENITFDLVQAMGLKNCVWRTPGPDGGRDIQGDWIIKDFSGFARSEKWYVECKRYKSSVDWPTVWGKIAFSEAGNANVLLLVTTSSLSPQAIDETNKWNESGKKPIVRFWGGQDLGPILAIHPEIAIKYQLKESSHAEIGGAILPLTSLLLKYIHAADSDLMFNAGTSRNAFVISAVGELISHRVLEISKYGQYSFSLFRTGVDGFDWLMNEQYLSECFLDRYGMRAIASILYGYVGKEIVVLKKENLISISLDRDLPGALAEEVELIARWSYTNARIDRISQEVHLERQKQ